MSNTIDGLAVTLEEGIREEHAALIADCIRQLKGVIYVQKVDRDFMSADHAAVQVKLEIQTKIMEVLRGQWK